MAPRTRRFVTSRRSPQASRAPARPVAKAPRDSGSPPRLIGRAIRQRGRWYFDPARRWRGGRRDLTWRGRHEPDDGDFCIAEVPDEGPAWLVEVLGADDRPEWDEHAIESQFRLRVRFPDAVARDADGFGEPTARDLRGRLDLRGALVFTIDPEDAKDHDDALSVEPVGPDRFEVGIHIADVSHYVTPGSALDAEARERGTSTYLPGGVVPMIPPALSNDVCSLKPDRDRLALSVIVTLDTKGRRYGARFAETVIRSRHRLAYGTVQAMLVDGTGAPPDLLEALARARDLARGLRAVRRARGALELEVPEVKAWVDEHGAPVRIERRPHLESHELIEEFMLLANRCVGEEGANRSAGLLYRVHDVPAPAKLEALDAMLKTLALPRPGSLGDPARALQELLRVPLDPPKRRLLHRLVLRSLARAQYLERDTGHFGLATRDYCHFTSPIRRYPDLHNHARVREWIRGRPTDAWDPVALAALARACTATEQTAADAERESVKVKALRMLEPRLGEHMDGMITGFLPAGFFVELEEIPVEGFVRLSLYVEDRFDLDASGVRMVGRRTRHRFTLGDQVRVTVARVDVPARECDLALEQAERRRKRRGEWRG
jgi:ribonuclease R